MLFLKPNILPQLTALYFFRIADCSGSSRRAPWSQWRCQALPGARHWSVAFREVQLQLWAGSPGVGRMELVTSAEELWRAIKHYVCLWYEGRLNFGRGAGQRGEQKLLNEWKLLVHVLHKFVLTSESSGWGTVSEESAIWLLLTLSLYFWFSSWLFRMVFDTLDIFHKICAEPVMLFSLLSQAEKVTNSPSFTHTMLLRSQIRVRSLFRAK